MRIIYVAITFYWCSAAALSLKSSRRTFLSQASVVATGTTFGMFVNHHLPCSCSSCAIRLGPNVAYAEPAAKDISNIQLSPDFYAQDLEAKRTLSRLERGGFKLDTDQEQTNRLNDALSSFSYDSVTNSKKKSSNSTSQITMTAKEPRKN